MERVLTGRGRRVTVSVLLLAVSAVGAYFVLRPSSCDGLPREIGACDNTRPVYSGETCEAVAAEWGAHLNERALAVIEGPAVANGKAMSSRLYDVETLVSQLANKHMRDSALTPQCEPEAFFLTGESQLSPEVVERVGGIMYEGNPTVEYEEWRIRLQEWITLILTNPHEAYAP